MITRRDYLRWAGLAITAPAAALVGCTPTPTPSPVPVTPTPTPSRTPTIFRDFTEPGEARKIVEELISAAGTIQAIKVEVERTFASLSVVSGMEARTYAWRDGHITKVESDTRYVGQAIFDPRDFHFDDLSSLFATARSLAKSTAPQQLQIVEYSDRVVLMTVTTNPESATVFFRKDGTLISPVDLTTAAGLAEAMTDAIGSKKLVLAIGVLPGNGGCYVDSTGGDGVIVRSIRMPKLPVRIASRREATALEPFNPLIVKPSIVVATLRKALDKQGVSVAPWSVTIDRRGGVSEPRMYFSVAGTDLVTTLTGVDVTPR